MLNLVHLSDMRQSGSTGAEKLRQVAECEPERVFILTWDKNGDAAYYWNGYNQGKAQLDEIAWHLQIALRKMYDGDFSE